VRQNKRNLGVTKLSGSSGLRGRLVRNAGSYDRTLAIAYVLGEETEWDSERTKVRAADSARELTSLGSCKLK